MISNILIIMCIVCAIGTAVLVNFAKPLCSVLGVMDIPDARKIHNRETPLMGGLTLLIVLLPLCAVAYGFIIDPAYQQAVIIMIAATAIIAIVGIADDRHSLSATNRIILTSITFAAAAFIDPIFNVRFLQFAITTPTINIGMAISAIAIFFTTLCCVGLVNAINMADGKNGLVTGLCLGWLMLLATRAPAPLMPVIMLFLAAMSVLFIANVKGWLFLGDGGSYGFGAAIAFLTIATYNSFDMNRDRALFAEEAMLLFAVPVLDSFRLTFVRLYRGQSPMAGDRNHLHHHLLEHFGWPKGLVIYLICALLPAAALFAWRL
jgi:UDP-GlcNAc:undecaprenyl-phosphate/decaprenyl-phosphate GlcNAc-1-phosphate transferase